MRKTNIKPKLSIGEFAAMMAYMISLVALSIDAMLPALDIIGHDLGVNNINKTQYIIAALFFGLYIGQIIYGPVSDSTGRKPAIIAGLGLFIIGCFFSMFAKSFEIMLFGRFLQGLGVAGPRIVSIAVVRDLYVGRSMAKVSSIIMAFFIIVPAIAPLLGQFIENRWNWRAIFMTMIFMAIMIALWYGIRQGETLHVENKRNFSVARIIHGYKEALSTRITLLYSLAAGVVYGSFLVYLFVSPQLFADAWDVKDNFPYYFGALAICIGAAALVNAKLVEKIGMRQLCKLALIIKFIWAVLFLILLMLHGWHIGIGLFMLWAGLSFFLLGILFGNINAIAMEPVGHIAGFGSAVVGSLTGFVSLALGLALGHYYSGNAIILIAGFAAFAPLSLFIMMIADKGHEVENRT